MKSISCVEHRDNGVLLKASSKEEVEHAIMKENFNRFRLAYAYSTLEGCLYYELGSSGEGPLSLNLFTSQEQSQNRLEAKEIFELFRYSSHSLISSNITTK